MSQPTSDAATEKEVRQLLKRLARLKKNWPQEPALRDLSPQMVDVLLKHLDGILNPVWVLGPVASMSILLIIINSICATKYLVFGNLLGCAQIGFIAWYIQRTFSKVCALCADTNP